MKTVAYIHGYGSDGNAVKGRLLREMLPDCRVVSPSFDYDCSTPWQIQNQIRQVIENEKVSMLVGSSFGGYHALCATTFFHGPVWAINPVHDVEGTILRVIAKDSNLGRMDDFVKMYNDFDMRVFRQQSLCNCNGGWRKDTPLYFALSTDDELLENHQPLLQLFPQNKMVIWKDDCGHGFFRFEELKEQLLYCL